MRFTFLTLPALAVLVHGAAVTTRAPATSEAPAATSAAGPATYSNSESAMKSAVSEMEKKSPPPAIATSSHTGIAVIGAPASIGPAKPAITTTTMKVFTTTKAMKPKTTTTTTTKAKKGKTTTTTAKQGKATPDKKKPAVKRQNVADCGAMQKTYDYTPSQNFSSNAAILTNFYNDTVFNTASKAGVAPKGYSWVYQGFYASANTDYYMSYMPMSTYNVTACAAICDNTPYCRSFNIFYERTPSLSPAPACPNPTAFTAIRCTFWNIVLQPKHASNYGEWRQSFPLVITGSNAYTKG
ncbi:Hypothetical protein D9617_6g092500 [Elsinoe fawcettii]|nr:Hypothetical protein D9617_6g092500 [Elsinoe fawcettii]